MYMKLLSFKLLLIGGEVILYSSFADSATAKMVKNTMDTGGGGGGGGRVEFVKCECCGLSEECTPAYIATVRESNHGRWICGLCAEAVKEEMERSCSESEEDALDRHMRFCKNFRSSMSSPATNPAENLIAAVKQLLIRSLDSPRSPGSSSIEQENSDCRRLSPTSSIAGSNGCR
ncbi:hypothetical protein E3N88_09277 [Mikania micrantha]|uniref:DUF1677 domain-containing protein n=1 Tax=Mikania micrantha TaxID=192012 RepID=A0A5N6PKJ5_9ASTR|nr:hypothetical protein E3N88_09277 [Mikania micrantha]